MTAPTFDHDLCLGQRVKDFAIQKFIAKPGVERLDEAVLPWTAWRDVGCLRADCGNPVLHRFCDELRAVVGTDVSGDAAQDEQVAERVDDISRSEPSLDADR
jgi:hypothetical protein